MKTNIISDALAIALLSAHVKAAWSAKTGYSAIVKSPLEVTFDTIRADGMVETAGVKLSPNDWAKVGVGGEIFPVTAKKVGQVSDVANPLPWEAASAAAQAAGVPITSAEVVAAAIQRLRNGNPGVDLSGLTHFYAADTGRVAAFRIPAGAEVKLFKYGSWSTFKEGDVLCYTSTKSVRGIGRAEFLEVYRLESDVSLRSEALMAALPELTLEELDSIRGEAPAEAPALVEA